MVRPRVGEKGLAREEGNAEGNGRLRRRGGSSRTLLGTGQDY